MSTITNLIVDTLVYMHANGTYSFEPVIYRDGSALSLTGKTVTATVRRMKNPGNVLHTTYEDMAVTLGNTGHTAAQGGVTLSFSPDSTYFTTPRGANEWEDYFVQFHIMPDDYYPARMLLHITRNID